MEVYKTLQTIKSGVCADRLVPLGVSVSTYTLMLGSGPDYYWNQSLKS